MENKISNYYDAVHYFGNSYILCNSVTELDEFWFEALYGDWWNDGDELPDIYQYFISNCSEGDVRYLCDSFGLLFYYSEKLDCFILCVPHFGTMWKGVPVTDNRENI